MQVSYSIRDYLAVARRRFWVFATSLAVCLAVGIALATSLPPIFVSNGRILIESQQVPEDLIRSTITGVAHERIEIIKQRVMTRQNLEEIVNDHALYAEQDTLSMLNRVEKLRSRIAIDLVQTGSTRNRSIIALDVSYEDEAPEKALSVTQDLVTLLLDENVKARTSSATQTTEFLRRQADALEVDLRALEDQLAVYKRQNRGALPEQLDLHLDMLQRARGQLRDTEADIGDLESEIRFLTFELDLTSRQIDISEGDGTTPAEQLAALQTRLTSLQARYVDQHPDIVALRDEIRAIEQSMGGNESSTQRLALIQQFLSEEDELQARLARGADAQSILEAENAVNATRERLQALPVSVEPYEDATTTMLKTQERMSAARQRMALLEQSRQTLINRISDLEGRVAQTPDIQLGIVALSRDIETTQIQYEELRAKELEAQLSQNLEEDSKAERFSLLEPPVRAEFPSKPNRLLIVAAGAMAGIGLGAALTLFLELVFGRVTRPVVIKEIFGAPPLSTIPELYPPQNRSAGSGPTGSAMAQRGSV